MLVLEEGVDWHPGDEAVIIGGMGIEGAGPMEEVVVVEAVHNADLHLRTPLRYSNFSLDRFTWGKMKFYTNWALDIYLFMRYSSIA